ncbi:hypothetical protein NDI36_27060 [Leptolyngbya boryana FACHB-1624]|uniref:hypothetical protein n=2 Tax=Leptolyngbya group TaxID=3081713 RepID=UPI00257D693F|nr:hypothetical protein [Leptolyngbya sp. UWPOB_LEPTO1]
MDEQQSVKRSDFFMGTSFYLNGNARFVSQNIRDLGSKFQIKMVEQSNSPIACREGFAFEFLDAMDQQFHLGGKVQVDVLGINGKNSPDIQIRDRFSGNVIREQQHKRSAGLADNAAKSGAYGNQEIRTPKQQAQSPKNSNVQESNVSAQQVSEGAKRPLKAIRQYQIKSAIVEVSHAAATGAVAGGTVAILLSGLTHFLAVERGEIELDQAIVATFLSGLEGALTGGVSSAAFAAIPAFLPVLVPVLHIVSASLVALGAYQLVTQIGQILDHHSLTQCNAVLRTIHHQESKFFEARAQRVVNYLLS